MPPVIAAPVVELPLLQSPAAVHVVVLGRVGEMRQGWTAMWTCATIEVFIHTAVARFGQNIFVNDDDAPQSEMFFFSSSCFCTL